MWRRALPSAGHATEGKRAVARRTALAYVIYESRREESWTLTERQRDGWMDGARRSLLNSGGGVV